MAAEAEEEAEEAEEVDHPQCKDNACRLEDSEAFTQAEDSSSKNVRKKQKVLQKPDEQVL